MHGRCEFAKPCRGVYNPHVWWDLSLMSLTRLHFSRISWSRGEKFSLTLTSERNRKCLKVSWCKLALFSTKYKHLHVLQLVWAVYGCQQMLHFGSTQRCQTQTMRQWTNLWKDTFQFSRAPKSEVHLQEEWWQANYGVSCRRWKMVGFFLSVPLRPHIDITSQLQSWVPELTCESYCHLSYKHPTLSGKLVSGHADRWCDSREIYWVSRTSVLDLTTVTDEVMWPCRRNDQQK